MLNFEIYNSGPKIKQKIEPLNPELFNLFSTFKKLPEPVRNKLGETIKIIKKRIYLAPPSA